MEHLRNLSFLNVESVGTGLTVVVGVLLSRQTCYVLAEKFFEVVLAYVARNDEVHACKIAEALVVNLVDTVEAYLVHAVSRERLGALAFSVYGYAQRVVVGDVRACVAVTQHRLLFGYHILEYGLVLARIGEVEIHYLQPRLKVGRHANSLHTFFLVVDVWHHAQRLAPALLLESEKVEVGSSALFHNASEELQRRSVGVRIERATAHAKHVYSKAVGLDV